jgi:hypothetical protein
MLNWLKSNLKYAKNALECGLDDRAKTRQIVR